MFSSVRNLWKKPHSGIWKPQPGDNFSYEDLQTYRAFFADDLHKAQQDKLRWKAFIEKHPKLTKSKKGFGGMLEVLDEAIYEAEVNLKTVTELIANFPL